jgi:hypothetical protein
MLRAVTRFDIGDFACIKFFSENDARLLAEEVRKHNVFARSRWQNSFYIRRAEELAGKTVIELFRPGTPDEIVEEERIAAAFLERLVVLSSTFSISRTELHRKLGISKRAKTASDFVVGPEFRYLRSQSPNQWTGRGLKIDGRFNRSFYRNGFGNLVATHAAKGDMAQRIRAALQWLFESRIETNIESSVVKTAIAYERLLIFAESESLAQSLAERTAFILSEDANQRVELSKIVKAFYDTRSGVVHGSQRKLRRFSPRLLEKADRIALLLCLKLAANSALWPVADPVRIWCENQKWGQTTEPLLQGFSNRALNSTLRLVH